MRSPSAKVLRNRCDIYPSTPGRDADGGVQFPYAATPQFSQVPCTAQAITFAEVEDQANRITQVTEWKIIFGAFIAVSPRDKLIFADGGDVLHTAFVEASRDEANRGAAFTIRAVERV